MSEEKKIYCTQCGNQNDPSSKFCCNCGAKLERPDFGGGEETSKQEACFRGTRTVLILKRLRMRRKRSLRRFQKYRSITVHPTRAMTVTGPVPAGTMIPVSPGTIPRSPMPKRREAEISDLPLPLWYAASFPCYAAAWAFSVLCWPLPQLYLALSPCASNTTGRGWRLPELQPAA